MKQKLFPLLALILYTALLRPTMVMAQDVTPEFFLEMTDDAQEQYLKNIGMSYEEATGLSTDGGAALLDDGYVQCDNCGGWYMNGNEFRNHICTGNSSNPSSSWTSSNDYYDALVNGNFSTSTMTAIGTLYISTANGRGLNMRTRPNVDGDILAIIPNGSAVTLYWYENASWAYVSYRGHTGFCMTRHLSGTAGSTSSSASTLPETNPANMFKGFYQVSYIAAVKPSTPSGFVNMRWAPSKSADVQCIYYADTILRVLATNGTWSQVYNEQTRQCGFMMNAYLNAFLY